MSVDALQEIAITAPDSAQSNSPLAISVLSIYGWCC